MVKNDMVEAEISSLIDPTMGTKYFFHFHMSLHLQSLISTYIF